MSFVTTQPESATTQPESLAAAALAICRELARRCWHNIWPPLLFNEAAAAVATPEVRSPGLLRSLMAGLVLAVAPLSVMGVAAPTAHADYAVDSSNFLGVLSSRGITYTSRQAAIAAAHEVCSELDRGGQASDVANNVMTQSALDGYHAGFFVGVSIAAFCPRHSQ
jgi:Protein of unknown function (DUF732)